MSLKATMHEMHTCVLFCIIIEVQSSLLLTIILLSFMVKLNAYGVFHA